MTETTPITKIYPQFLTNLFYLSINFNEYKYIYSIPYYILIFYLFRAVIYFELVFSLLLIFFKYYYIQLVYNTLHYLFHQCQYLKTSKNTTLITLYYILLWIIRVLNAFIVLVDYNINHGLYSQLGT